jgi:hypothetical protein
MERWQTYVDARAEAAGWMLAVAVEYGSDSPVHRQAQALWHDAEASALASLEHADPENAVLVLRNALDILSHAPEILKRRELTEEDLIGLMGG